MRLLIILFLLVLPVQTGASSVDMTSLVEWARGKVSGVSSLRHTTADGTTYAVDRVRVSAVGDEIVIRIRPRRVSQ